MLKSFFKEKYLIYGSSIIISRGLEYALLFFAAGYFSKQIYGEFEYYKKLIEVGSMLVAFGLPSLLMSYTKSADSKRYLYFISSGFSLLIALVLLPIFYFSGWLNLSVSFAFYALFFTGGITQSYLLVSKGSNSSSLYKVLVSVLFYGIVFSLIYLTDIREESYIYTSYILFPITLLFWIWHLVTSQISISKLRKYGRLFRRLIGGAATIVISDFTNILFVYTDIFIIKILSDQANIDIANFSFALNVATILLLIPTTLIQVEIERLKNEKKYIKILDKNISLLTVLVAIGLIIGYFMLVNYLYPDYRETLVLFCIIICAKIFQSLSMLFGTNLLILKLFPTNLKINITMLIANIVIAILLYHFWGINGIAVSSFISLFTRYLWLRKINRIHTGVF